MNDQQVRKNALICIFASALLLLVNHLSVLFNGMGYFLIPYISCIGILFGSLGFIETDVYKLKDDWSLMPSRLKYWKIALLICGLLAGYCINRFVYHSGV